MSRRTWGKWKNGLVKFTGLRLDVPVPNQDKSQPGKWMRGESDSTL